MVVLGSTPLFSLCRFFLAAISVIFIIFSRYTVERCNAERDPILYCGACIALTEELNWQTGITDPKKKIQVSNYKINEKGELTVPLIPLATSEVHITEIFMDICRYMYGYVKHIDNNKRTSYVQTQSRDGIKIGRLSVTETREIKSDLQFACDTILEEHEDWLMTMYQAMDQEITTKLCVNRAGLCSEQNVSDQTWAYAAEVMGGMKNTEKEYEEFIAARDKAEAEELAKYEDDKEEEDETKDDSHTIQESDDDEDSYISIADDNGDDKGQSRIEL